MSIIDKIFGSSDEHEIKRLQKTIDAIEQFEPAIQALSDDQMREKTEEFKGRHEKGQTLDDILPEAYALVREAAIRTIGQRHYRVQLIGGVVLHQGRIAEMRTGEGKTLVSTLAAYLNALGGNGVHIVTVNDYLAKRDSEWMGKIHRFLGLSVGLILHDMRPSDRKLAYLADITYGTNSEFGFDFLRDNMVVYKDDMVQRDLNYAIIDEVDSILIDEARTPLIISGVGEKSTEMYSRVDHFVVRLRDEEDYVKDEKLHTVNLTEQGVHKAEQAFSVTNLSDFENTELMHHINQALKAHVLMHRDRDYVVQNDEVLIVDEFTGRIMTGRRYSEGLHQAIEAKEKVKVERESKTMATITYQNYFRMYKKLSGMTGTAKTEEPEFRGIYGLDVVIIPTNKPMIRKYFNDVVYRSEKGKFEAVVAEIMQRQATGQPVLVGTVSVEKSERLSRLLELRGINHAVLNAKNHAKEAEIVAQAGKYQNVTIATNMAGRGTDILLGGNPDFLSRREMRRQGFADEMIEAATSHQETQDEEILAARGVYSKLFENYKKETDAEKEKVIGVGGLHIIGTERHESRRIDNQLRGRSGRQGDPGSSRFYVSLEDDLMRLFGSDRITPMIERLGLQEDQPIENGLLSKQIETAQKRVESRNFDIRKHVLQYDDVMNRQREIIYGQRRKVLRGEDVHGYMEEMLGAVIERAVSLFAPDSAPYEEWNIKGLHEYLGRTFLVPNPMDEMDAKLFSNQELVYKITQYYQTAYAEREETFKESGVNMRDIERIILLRIVDEKWMDHIDAMDQLREGIGLRAYGQRDPVVEYRLEGFDMFDEMINSIQEDTLSALFSVSVERTPVQARPQVRLTAKASESPAQPEKTVKQPIKSDEKVGRNDPCPCGSGRKFKNCCEE